MIKEILAMNHSTFSSTGAHRTTKEFEHSAVNIKSRRQYSNIQGKSSSHNVPNNQSHWQC